MRLWPMKRTRIGPLVQYSFFKTYHHFITGTINRSEHVYVGVKKYRNCASIFRNVVLSRS